VIAGALVVAVVVVPLIFATTINMIVLSLFAIVLMLYGGTNVLTATGIGVGIVFLELESAWNKHPLTIQIAAAVSGLALLAAFELRAWAEELARTPSDRVAYHAKARQLALRIGTIGAILAALVVLAHGFVHGPLLGLLGGLAAIGVGAGLVWLSVRPSRA
jgi:hypothetical protein